MVNTGKGWLFILNPASGTVRSEVWERAIRIAFPDACLKITQRPGDGIKLTDEAASEFHTVVAVGGDGTVREVGSSLLAKKATLAILPTGSGNGLARHLGIATDISKALHQLVYGTAISVDAYRANGVIGCNVCGIGFDARVAAEMVGKQKRGLTAYIKLSIKNLSFLKSRDFNVNGKSFKAFIVAVCNSSQYGNNAVISRGSSVQDGMLECIIMESPRWWELPWMILCLNRGWFDSCRKLHRVKESRFEITTADPMPFHIDGEYMGNAINLTVEAVPGALRMLVPANRHASC